MLDIKSIDTEELIELRHQLHALAEVSGEEKKTAKKIESFLKETGPDELITGVGGTGIIARYSANKPGPKIMIRCELDALPIAEDNNLELEYLSKDENTGHKCGHDGHMAIVCGLAQLAGSKELDKGELLLLFQPAEETGQGAQRVLADEQFNKVETDYIFALHNLPGFEKHQIVIKEDTFAAASVGLVIRLKGETSHAAHPEEGKSPSLAVAHLIQDLSALTQFYTSLDKAAKATVIHAKLGEEAFGTSPGYAEVMATLRTYEDQTLEKLKQKSLDIVEGISNTYELDVETEWVESFSATTNDSDAVDIIKSVAKAGNLSLLEKAQPFSWSEDFGQFTKAGKGAMFGLGAGKEQPALHASNYDFPDDIIETGIRMFTGIIDKVLMSNE